MNKKKNKILVSIILAVSLFLTMSFSFIIVFAKETKAKEDKSLIKQEEVVANEDLTGASLADASEKGGAIYLEENASFTLRKGTFVGSRNSYGGTVYVSSGSTFNMLGGTIEASKARYGGAIYVESGATCNIYGGTIENCSAIKNFNNGETGGDGGAIYVEKGGILNIVGEQVIEENEDPTKTTVHFINNTADANGGAIYLNDGKDLELYEAVIDGCSALNGGAIYSPENITIGKEGYETSILNCFATNYGGALYLLNTEATDDNVLIQHSSIYENSTKGTGAGVYLKGAKATILSSEILSNEIIEGGSVSDRGRGAGVYASANSTITITEGVISGNKLNSDTANQMGAGIYIEKGKVYLESGIIENNSIKEGVSGRGAGIYVYNTSEIIVGSENQNLDSVLIKNNVSSDTAGGIAVYYKSKLFLNSGTIEDNSSKNRGGGIYSTESELVLKENVLIKSNKSNGGGGLYLYNNSKLDLTGSKIEDNEAYNSGGGISASYGSSIKVTIKNAQISKNKAKLSGGGVYLDAGSIELNQSIVSQNKIENLEESSSGNGQGGGIFVKNAGSIVTLTNNTLVTENIIETKKATNYGAGIAVRTSATLNLKSANISNNVLVSGKTASNEDVSNRGAGVFVDSSTINVGENNANNSTVNITNNNVLNDNLKAVLGSKNIDCEYGGGILLYNNTSLKINAGTIEGNKSKYSGGIHSSKCNVTINDCLITENVCETFGGGLRIMNGSSFTMSGGVISKNIARTSGAGLSVSDKASTINLLGGEISENYISPQEDYAQGAGLHINGAVTNLKGAIIKDNYILNSNKLYRPFGGGVYVCGEGILNFSSGEIFGNLACAEKSGNEILTSSNQNSVGGNIFVMEDGILNMTGGLVAGTRDEGGNYTNKLQAFFGGGIASLGKAIVSGGVIENCHSKYGGAIGSYGGVKIDKETIANKVSSLVAGLVGDHKIDIRSNRLVVGSVQIRNCSADIGASIATGYEIEFFGFPNIDNEISMSALSDVYYKLSYIIGSTNVSLLEDDAKQYPEIYISDEFNPETQLKIIFSQANVEAKIEGGVNAIYNISNNADMMREKFVDTNEVFIYYKDGVEARPSDFLVGADVNNEKQYYIVAKTSNQTIVNSNFNKESLTFEEEIVTGTTLSLHTSLDNPIYKFTLTEDESAYTVSMGFDDYYDPNANQAQSFVKTLNAEKSWELTNMPTEHKGLPVIGITAKGFENLNVVSINLPTSYTLIGERALAGTNITTINLEKVKEIGAFAFENTNLVGEYSLDNIESIGESAFVNQDEITDLILGEGLISIGANAFNGLVNLTNLTVNSVNLTNFKAGEKQFYNAGKNSESLSVIIGEDCHNVPDYLFDAGAEETYITHIDFQGMDLRYVGRYAFNNAKKMKGIANFQATSTIGAYAFNNCESFGNEADGGMFETSFDGVKNIYERAFYNCKNLTGSVYLISIETISWAVFEKCSSLTEITLGEELESIGKYSFKDCTSLTNINYNAINCSNLVEYNQTFLNIGNSNSPLKVTLGENVQNIPNYIFDVRESSSKNVASNITEIEILGSNVTRVGKYAFNKSTKMAGTLNLLNVESIEQYAFNECGEISGIVDGSLGKVVTLGNYTFNNCKKMAGRIDVSSLVEMEDRGYQFKNCYLITGDIVLQSYNDDVPLNAFDTCKSITSLVCGEGVKILYNSSFNGCSSMTEIYIANATATNRYSFSNCSKLSYVDIFNDEYENRYTNITKIDGYAFTNDKALTVANIPDSVTYLGPKVFQNCTSLTIATIGSGLDILGTAQDKDGNETTDEKQMAKGYQVFNGCSNIKTIKLNSEFEANSSGVLYSNGVKTIGKNAFIGCSRVTDITIPTTVTTLQDSAFYGLGSRATVNVTIVRENCGCTYVDGSLCSHALNFGSTLFGGVGASIGKITIKAQYAWVGDTKPKYQKIVIPTNAFKECQVQELELSDVYEIKAEAFKDCYYLTDLTLYGYAQQIQIGSKAFAYCYALENINYRVKHYQLSSYSLPSDVFTECGEDVVTIDPFDQTTEIYGNANGINLYIGPFDFQEITLPTKFFANTNIVNIEFSNKGGDVYVEKDTFFNLAKLKSVKIPYTDYDGHSEMSTNTHFVSYFISHSSGVSTPYYSVRPTIYIDYEQTKCYRTLFNYTQNAQYMGACCGYCPGMTIQYSTPDIAGQILDENLLFILNSNGTTYGVKARNSYISGEITIPATYQGLPVTKIIKDGFYNCSRITSITIPSSVTEIGEGAFMSCSKLSNIVVNANVTTLNNFVFYECGKNATSLEVYLPDSLTTIGSYCFYNCATITKVDFGINIKTIKNYAFADCKNMKPEGLQMSNVTEYGDYAFKGCLSLAENNLSLSSNVSVGEYAFYNSGLTGSLYVNMKEISSWAFARCKGVSELNIGSNVAKINSTSFAYMSGLVDLDVDNANSVYENYETSLGTNVGVGKSNIIVERGRLKDTEYLGVFPKTIILGCVSSEEAEEAVGFGWGITAIGDYAFSGCTNLKYFSIDETTRHIGEYAFAECSNLIEVTLQTVITIGYGLRDIGDYAFTGCDSLVKVEVWRYTDYDEEKVGTDKITHKYDL